MTGIVSEVNIRRYGLSVHTKKVRCNVFLEKGEKEIKHTSKYSIQNLSIEY
jgi:hypothetical protein